MESREHAEAAAAAWIARRERDDWSAVDEMELDAWIKAAADNRVAWLRLNTAWQQTSRLKSLVSNAAAGAVPAHHELHLPFFDSGKERNRSETPGFLAKLRDGMSVGRVGFVRALAASVLIALAVATTWYVLPRGPHYRTAIGELQAVPLADGSRVTLNTNTQIRVDVTQTARRIDLEQGEAYFEVAKDPSRPFIVAAGDKQVIAVGTRFSVRREKDEIRVLVTEGRVRVEQDARGAGESEIRADGGAAVLAAGSIARARDDGVLVLEKSVGEVEQLLSWRVGRLTFDQTALADAVAEFNRYNARKIVIQDASVAAIRVGGNFRASNVEAFIRLIASDFPIVVTQREDEIVLTQMPQ